MVNVATLQLVGWEVTPSKKRPDHMLLVRLELQDDEGKIHNFYRGSWGPWLTHGVGPKREEQWTEEGDQNDSWLNKQYALVEKEFKISGCKRWTMDPSIPTAEELEDWVS